MLKPILKIVGNAVVASVVAVALFSWVCGILLMFNLGLAPQLAAVFKVSDSAFVQGLTMSLLATVLSVAIVDRLASTKDRDAQTLALAGVTHSSAQIVAEAASQRRVLERIERQYDCGIVHLGNALDVYGAALQMLSHVDNGTIVRHAHLIWSQDLESEPVPEHVQRFADRFEQIIETSGPGAWDVRQLVVIPTKRRANLIAERVRGRKQAHLCRVKVWINSSFLPYASVLIVGDDHAILGFDNPPHPFVGEALQLRGKSVVAPLIRYFDTLFDGTSGRQCTLLEIRTSFAPDEERLTEMLTAAEALLPRPAPTPQ